MLMMINNPEGVSVERGVDFAEGQLLNVVHIAIRAGRAKVRFPKP